MNSLTYNTHSISINNKGYANAIEVTWLHTQLALTFAGWLLANMQLLTEQIYALSPTTTTLSSTNTKEEQELSCDELIAELEAA